MANPWFRFYSEFEDDPKVQMMSEVDQRRLVLLFCQRCKEEKRTDSQQSFKWCVSLDEVARTKALFVENGFIDENWNLLNWNKRQFISDSSTERVRRHRRGEKQSETLQKRDETFDVTKCNALEERRTEQIRNRGEENRRSANSGNGKRNGDFSSLLSISHGILPSPALPKNKAEMIADGYTFSNKRACSVCGAELEWWKSAGGRQLPVLAETGDLHLGMCAAEMKGAK
jgi:hypothetical protein